MNLVLFQKVNECGISPIPKTNPSSPIRKSQLLGKTSLIDSVRMFSLL